MSTLIVTGGKVNKRFIENYLSKYKYNNIIAVDKGLEILDKINVVPNYIIGDFDSIKREILNKYENNKNIEIHKYSSEKDYTDTHIAISMAIKLKENIDIVGAIGTRLDHTIANIHTLTEGLKENIIIKIINEKNEIQITDKTISIEYNKNYKYISLIPLTEEVSAITLKGFKYKLSEYTLSLGKSIGISNELSEKCGIIEFKKGILIVIQSKD